MGMLENKVAIITGGTRGIGYATVKAFLKEGARVALFGSKAQTVETALAKLKEELGDCAILGLSPDITDMAQVKAAFQTVVDQWGTLDILVNNAGISQSAPIANYSEGDFDAILDLNVKAVMLCSQAAVLHMRPKKNGVILNTSSVVSLYGQKSGCGYPTSKFAVNGFTRSLARELGPDHIRVNAVLPGVTSTDMVAALPAAVVAQISATIPLGRVGLPEEIADAFVFLASDRASYISGALLSVDGATQV